MKYRFEAVTDDQIPVSIELNPFASIATLVIGKNPPVEVTQKTLRALANLWKAYEEIEHQSH